MSLLPRIWHVPAHCLPNLDLFPSVPHRHAQWGPAPSGIKPEGGVLSDAMPEHPGNPSPAQGVLGDECLKTKMLVPYPTQAFPHLSASPARGPQPGPLGD